MTKNERLLTMSPSMGTENQAFWIAFNECFLEVQSTEGMDPELKSLIIELTNRKNIRRGVVSTPTQLGKLTSHPSFEMYNENDVRREFGKIARDFWEEWDKFEETLQKCPVGTPIYEKANGLLHSYGLDVKKNSKCPDQQVLQDIHNSEFFNSFTSALLVRMCMQETNNIRDEEDILKVEVEAHESQVDAIKEEKDLLLYRKYTEQALLTFQRVFLKLGPLRVIIKNLERKRTTIKVYPWFWLMFWLFSF